TPEGWEGRGAGSEERRCSSPTADRSGSPWPRATGGPGSSGPTELSRLSHGDLYRLSVTDPDRFWGAAAADRLRWVEPFHRVRDCDLSSGRIGWFLGGKLNVTYNDHKMKVKFSPVPQALITYSPFYEYAHLLMCSFVSVFYHTRYFHVAGRSHRR
uniref:Acetyl-coenzyme A synthetase N-terminal domain-containing protein n=1 Tax=Neolamprologus brichardi TaxID=32507 RepID=A0A3Q4GVR3_NEOBR